MPQIDVAAAKERGVVVCGTPSVGNPTSGIAAAFNNDFAGVGGNVRFLRETADVRRYFEVIYDIVGVLHLQAGNIQGWGNGKVDFGQIGANGVRIQVDTSQRNGNPPLRGPHVDSPQHIVRPG